MDRALPEPGAFFERLLGARSQLSRGESARAGEVFRSLLNARPDLAWTDRWIAEACSLAGDRKAAEQHWRRAVAAHPLNLGWRQGLVRVVLGNGELSDAVAIQGVAVQRMPGHYLAHQMMGELLLDKAFRDRPGVLVRAYHHALTASRLRPADESVRELLKEASRRNRL